jgi:hypothetical protein
VDKNKIGIKKEYLVALNNIDMQFIALRDLLKEITA